MLLPSNATLILVQKQLAGDVQDLPYANEVGGNKKPAKMVVPQSYFVLHKALDSARFDRMSDPGLALHNRVAATELRKIALPTSARLKR